MGVALSSFSLYIATIIMLTYPIVPYNPFQPKLWEYKMYIFEQMILIGNNRISIIVVYTMRSLKK